MVVLRTQLEVAHDDGDLGTRDHENEQHHKQEAEDVVVPAIDGRGR